MDEKDFNRSLNSVSQSSRMLTDEIVSNTNASYGLQTTIKKLAAENLKFAQALKDNTKAQKEAADKISDGSENSGKNLEELGKTAGKTGKNVGNFGQATIAVTKILLQAAKAIGDTINNALQDTKNYVDKNQELFNKGISQSTSGYLNSLKYAKIGIDDFHNAILNNAKAARQTQVMGGNFAKQLTTLIDRRLNGDLSNSTVATERMGELITVSNEAMVRGAAMDRLKADDRAALTAKYQKNISDMLNMTGADIATIKDSVKKTPDDLNNMIMAMTNPEQQANAQQLAASMSAMGMSSEMKNIISAAVTGNIAGNKNLSAEEKQIAFKYQQMGAGNLVNLSGEEQTAALNNMLKTMSDDNTKLAQSLGPQTAAFLTNVKLFNTQFKHGLEGREVTSTTSSSVNEADATVKDMRKMKGEEIQAVNRKELAYAVELVNSGAWRQMYEGQISVLKKEATAHEALAVAIDRTAQKFGYQMGVIGGLTSVYERYKGLIYGVVSILSLLIAKKLISRLAESGTNALGKIFSSSKTVISGSWNLLKGFFTKTTSLLSSTVGRVLGGIGAAIGLGSDIIDGVDNYKKGDYRSVAGNVGSGTIHALALTAAATGVGIPAAAVLEIANALGFGEWAGKQIYNLTSDDSKKDDIKNNDNVSNNIENMSDNIKDMSDINDLNLKNIKDMTENNSNTYNLLASVLPSIEKSLKIIADNTETQRNYSHLAN